MRTIDADALMPDAEHKCRYDVVTAYDIANAPTIDVEPVRHGHWIPFGSMHRCSICEETVLVPTTIAGIPTYDYCPHCGAKMEVEK